jgi:hypothetical protein
MIAFVMRAVKENKGLVFDPSLTNGAYTYINKGKVISLHNLGSLSDLLNHVLELEGNPEGFLQAYIEDVPCYTGKNIPSHTSFKLGKSCGQLEGFFRGREIPVEFVSPKKWQAQFSGLKGLSGNPRKQKLKQHAERLYPNLKPTLRQADALLMAHFLINHTNRDANS